MPKKLTFNGHKNHPKGNHYRGPSGEWKTGDTKEVEDKEAARLLADYPDVFTAAGETVSTETEDPKPEAGKKSRLPK